MAEEKKPDFAKDFAAWLRDRPNSVTLSARNLSPDNRTAEERRIAQLGNAWLRSNQREVK